VEAYKVRLRACRGNHRSWSRVPCPMLAPPARSVHCRLSSATAAALRTSAWQSLGPVRARHCSAILPYRTCRNVVSTDARQADLYDLLSHSVRETQYSFTPAGAPCFVRCFVIPEAWKWPCRGWSQAAFAHLLVVSCQARLGLTRLNQPTCHPLQAGPRWFARCRRCWLRCRAWCWSGTMPARCAAGLHQWIY